MNKKKEENHWYAFYTKSRAEKKVYERIDEQGFEVFLPLVTTIRQWSDRKKKIKVPLIRSYIFVRTNPKKIIDILKIPGIVRVLKYMGKPAIVKDYEIENLKILVREGQNVKRIEDISKLDIGVEVEIDSGPMKGLRGRCVDFHGKKSIVVEISSLGEFFQVTVPVSQIKVCQ